MLNFSYLSIHFVKIIKNALIVLTVFACCSSLLLASRDDTKASGAIDAKTFEVLTKAQELTEQGHYAEAIAKLDSIKNSKRLNSYAKSQMWNFYAYIYASQEKYRPAIEAYKKLVNEADAPRGLQLTAKYTMAQLYFQLEDYAAVIQLMQAYLKEIDKPTPVAHIILAQAHYESRSFPASLKNLKQAIRLERAEGKKIQENWLRLMAAIYLELNDTENTLKTYQQLARIYPKISYLKQIAGLHGVLGNERMRLKTYDAVYTHGALQGESEVLNLAYMYLGQDIPYRAGRIIESEMNKEVIQPNKKNVETLANAWAQANEYKKAIPALERAARLSDKGILHARLAGVHFDAGDFARAASAARTADRKGGLKSRSNNQMLLGMALFNIKQYEDALQAFRQAKQNRKSFRDARKWETYTLLEIERLRALAQSKFKLKEKTQQALQAEENNVEAIGGNLLKNQAPD